MHTKRTAQRLPPAASLTRRLCRGAGGPREELGTWRPQVLLRSKPPLRRVPKAPREECGGAERKRSGTGFHSPCPSPVWGSPLPPATSSP